MNAEEFAGLCRTEKDSIIESYFDPKAETAVGAKLKALGLNESQAAALRGILDDALTDVIYTLLVALDGGSSLGGIQQLYDLRDESGTSITGEGDLESAAFEHFQQSST